MAEIETVTFAQVAAEMLWQLEHPEAMARMRIQTGMEGLDVAVNPMRGELVVLGAEQGSGKSTMLNTICATAARQGRRVLLFTLEDSKMELRARMLGLAAGVPPHESLRGRELSDFDRARVRRELERLQDVQFHIARNERRMDSILETIEAVAEADGLDIVVVDYLQALDGFTGSQDRRNQVREMVQRLQHVAREHEVMLILASQIIRPESRKVGEEPNRHWLKEASDIADAADKILLMWRRQERDEFGSFGPTFIKCDKDKSGVAAGWRGQMFVDANSGGFCEGDNG